MAFTESSSPRLGDLAGGDDSPTLRIARSTPTLEDVYPKASEARAKGDASIDVEYSGLGREWEPKIACKSQDVPMIGVWGRVVARMREAPKAGAVDSGPITRLLVRFEVIAILDAWRRREVIRLTPRTTLAINQPQRRPRNVTIR